MRLRSRPEARVIANIITALAKDEHAAVRRMMDRGVVRLYGKMYASLTANEREAVCDAVEKHLVNLKQCGTISFEPSVRITGSDAGSHHTSPCLIMTLMRDRKHTAGDGEGEEQDAVHVSDGSTAYLDGMTQWLGEVAARSSVHYALVVSFMNLVLVLGILVVGVILGTAMYWVFPRVPVLLEWAAVSFWSWCEYVTMRPVLIVHPLLEAFGG